MIKKLPFTEEAKQNITSKPGIPPRLPKIHKENVPLRAIVSAIESATYKLVKFLQRF